MAHDRSNIQQRRINLLKKIYVVQEYYQLKHADGVTNVRICQNISAIYPMSLITFYAYLKTNARKELRELNEDFEKLNKFKDNVITAISSLEKSAI